MSALCDDFESKARRCGKAGHHGKIADFPRVFFYTQSLVKGKAIGQPELFKSVLGAAVAVLCGLLLWKTPPGEPWVNASYDYLFRFGAHAITNRVTVILMDNGAFDQFHQTRGQAWDRGLHAQLLNRLADDGCDLVVFDSFFRQPHTNDPQWMEPWPGRCGASATSC